MDTKQALYTFGTGENFHLQHYLGAHKEQVDGGGGIVSVYGLQMHRQYT